MSSFIKRFAQVTSILLVGVIGYSVLISHSAKLSTREAVLKCTLDKISQKALGFFAETTDAQREGDGGPSWTKLPIELRIPPVDWVEIRNDWLQGQKLIRRIDAQGTQQSGFMRLRRLEETPKKYSSNYVGQGWSTVLRINRDDLEMKEMINTPADYKREWWTRKCIIVDEKEFDDFHKSLFTKAKI